MPKHAFRNLNSDSYSLKFWFPGHQHHWAASYKTQMPDVLLAVIMQDILHLEYDAAGLTYFFILWENMW